MERKKINSYAVNHRHLLSVMMLLWITMPIVEHNAQALQIVTFLFLLLAVVFLVGGIFISKTVVCKEGADNVKLLSILLRDKRGEAYDALIFTAGIAIAYFMGEMNYVYLWIFFLTLTVANLLIPIKKEVE